MKRFVTNLWLISLLILIVSPTFSQSVDFPPAKIENDEGGVTVLIGEANYTVGFLDDFGAGAVVVSLNDASWVIDRNMDPEFSIPLEYQVLGQVTSNPLVSPFTYSLHLPIVPRGEPRDLDNDSKEDLGVIVMSVDVFTNMYGDPYWQDDREYGVGLASTRHTTAFDRRMEFVGGKVVVWTPDDEQGFPSEFGEDGLAFTDDDPIVTLPPGYTVVDMDATPFTFDRSSISTVDLIERDQSLQPADYSELSYADAFAALVDQMRVEYSFTELKGLDWDELYDEFHPRFVEADENEDFNAYADALREFSWAIPDGHVGASLPTPDAFFTETDGGLGIAIRELDDGRVIVNYVTPDSPAEAEGIELRAEIISINDLPILDAIDAAIPWSSPFSTYDRRRLQQLRYAVRFPVGTLVNIVYKNPDADKEVAVTLTAIEERDSFSYSSFLRDAPEVGTLPVQFEIMDNGYGYVHLTSFSQDPMIMLRLWEWMIDTLNRQQVPGLVIDLQDNGGGFNVDPMMAGYFFRDELVIGNDERYYDDVGFAIDPMEEERIVLPTDGRHYAGPIAVLVGPNCQSACESFAYDMSLGGRAAIVGQYTTSGLGGSITPVFMPDGVRFQFTISRALDADGNIRIEGKGVPPTVRVPVTEETLFAEGNALLDAAIDYLREASEYEAIDGGSIEIGDSVTDQLKPGERVQYTLNVPNQRTLDIVVSDSSGELDTILRIYVAGSGEVAVGNDDDPDGETRNSALRELEVPGGLTLIIEVGGYLENEAGEFTLTITER